MRTRSKPSNAYPASIDNANSKSGSSHQGHLVSQWRVEGVAILRNLCYRGADSRTINHHISPCSKSRKVNSQPRPSPKPNRLSIPLPNPKLLHHLHNPTIPLVSNQAHEPLAHVFDLVVLVQQRDVLFDHRIRALQR